MDECVLADLLERHGPALVLYARQWCAMPEDVVQEAFVKLAAKGRAPAAPVPWLYRVVRNQAISTTRSARRRQRHEMGAAQQDTWFAPDLDAALDGVQVTTALQGLPGPAREVVTLHLWGGLTFAQIAEVLGCSTSSAHRAYQAALQDLRERIVSCPRFPSPTSSK